MPAVRPPTTGSGRCSAAVLAALLGPLLLLFSSCGGKGSIVVALDEAFQASRPELARELEAGTAGFKVIRLRLKLQEAPGKALAELEAARGRGEAPLALVASPLVAAALPGPWRAGGAEESSLGGALLLAPEWRVAAPEAGDQASADAMGAFAAAASDPLPAYAAAGKAAGAYVASLAAQGGSPACGILFLEAPSRPRSALQAFVDAYAEGSGGLSPLVRELVAAEDEEARAEAAVKELLGSDLRLLFVALGKGGPAAIRAAARPGLVVGADYPGSPPPAALAFRIRPDEGGIAAALWASLPSEGGEAPARAPYRPVPALAELLPAAGDQSRRSFGPFLRGVGRAEPTR